MRNFSLGKLFGIRLELHSTFILLIAAITGFLAIFDFPSLVPTLVLLFFLFVSVFIHELFHSIVAISKGIKVEKITLLPIGGISLTEEIPEKPLDEFLIAVAGPMFNFIVVVLIALLLSFFPQLPWPWHIFTDPAAGAEELNQALLDFPLFSLFWVNLVLGAFNLFVPALPLDGGRVLRSILSWRLGFSKATRIAAGVSTVLSLFLFLIGFFSGNIILLIIAIFIYLGAGQENEFAALKETLKGVDLTAVLNKKPLILKQETTLEEAFQLLQKKNQTAFLVETGNGIGFVSVDVLEGIKRSRWPVVKVAEAAAELPKISLTDSPIKIVTKSLSRNYPFTLVYSSGKLVGVIDEEQLRKFLKITKLNKESQH